MAAKIMYLFLFGDLIFLSTANLLHTVLLFLNLLPGSLLNSQKTVADKTVLGFELLGRIDGIVDEGETRGSITTESGTEAKAENLIRLWFVHGSQFFLASLLRHGSLTRVENVEDLNKIEINQTVKDSITKPNHLLSAKKPVGHKPASAQSNGTVAHIGLI